MKCRLATMAILAIFAYLVLTDRTTAGDLHFFWGPKAIAFHRAGGLDARFLGDPNYFAMHADYPPLVPLAFALMHGFTREVPWRAAAFSAVVCLAASAALLEGAGALLVAASLAWAFTVAHASGGADPPLVLFEILALVALTFRRNDVVASIAIACAVMTKVEGATFAVAIVLAILLVQRNWKRAALVVAPALVLLAAWLTFVVRHGLLDTYRGGGATIHLTALPKTIVTMASVASYDLLWLPWLVPIVLVATGDRRRAALPLGVAILTLGAATFFYLHAPDPAWWIESSAPRVLLTPLAALTVAGIAAARPVETIPDAC